MGYAERVDKMIEVRYAGVVVGRSAIVRELDTRGLFLGITEPLPVGTPVTLHIADRAGGENVPGKVVAVSESQDLSHAGMRVRFADPQAATLFGTPVEAAAEPEPPPAPPPNPPSLPPATAAPEAPIAPQPSGHRRIVVDASAERARQDQAAAPPASDEAADDQGPDPSGAVTGSPGSESGRIPAPDPSAFGGGRRGRRQRRR